MKALVFFTLFRPTLRQPISQPCLNIVCTKGRTYSPTMTLRLELLGAAAANTQLLVATVHSRVLELEYGQTGGDLPIKVTVDEVIP